MVAPWRQVGITYIQYSAIAARLVRRALRPELREQALKIEDSAAKSTKWEAGKPVSKEAAL